MNWLQVGCPFCPSEVNLPSTMADMEVACQDCGKKFLVPIPRSPVVSAGGPLPPLSILRPPGGRGGNIAHGIAPVPRLPEAVPVGPATSASPIDGLRPPKLVPGMRPAAPMPWEMSPAARAQAEALFGADPKAIEPAQSDDLERRLRRERLRAYARWMYMTLAIIVLVAIVAYFQRPNS